MYSSSFPQQGNVFRCHKRHLNRNACICISNVLFFRTTVNFNVLILLWSLWTLKMTQPTACRTEYSLYLSFKQLLQSAFFLGQLVSSERLSVYLLRGLPQPPLQRLLFPSQVKSFFLPSHILHHHCLLLLAGLVTFPVCLGRTFAAHHYLVVKYFSHLTHGAVHAAGYKKRPGNRWKC